MRPQMPIRKFATEFAINMVGLGVVLLTQEDFPMLETPKVAARLRESPCHIYMVCRRPRLMFDPQSINVQPEVISGRFLLQDGLTSIPYLFNAKNGLGNDLRIECPYPHTSITIFSSNGERLHHSKASLLAREIGSPELRGKLALEVLYIGQAFGTEGDRTAPDRLKAHSTLQAIYSEAISRSPDKEVWLILWNFEPNMITSIDGRSKEYETTLVEDDLHIDHVLSTPVSEQQKINFTEAALINYFKPVYNTMFQNVFPSPAHTTYSQCYELDINSLVVEVDTEDLGVRLWTSAIKEEWHHLIQYELHSAEDRRSMFEILIPDGYNKPSSDLR